MKATILSAILTIAITIGLKAQNLVAVQNGSNVSFYTQVTSAIAAAASGDTIYIPGGRWNLGGINSPVYITKTLHIIGTGHNPASTQAGGICFLDGYIYLRSGASNGSLTGVLLSGAFGGSIAYQNDVVVNYSCTRNRIGAVYLFSGFSGCVFAENVIDGSVDGGNAANNVFSNNIFASTVGDFSVGNMFKNNLWMNTNITSGPFSYCIFDNNIIFSSARMGTVTNSVFNNNLFVDNISFPWGTNTGSNNIVSQAQSSIFVSQTGNTFNYTQDYHLKSSCPGKNAGKDATDIGIYGGVYPWKEGSIPFNPHVESVNIAPSTNSSGNLKVNIKVEAQDH
jgi:hypothetical protein